MPFFYCFKSKKILFNNSLSTSAEPNSLIAKHFFPISLNEAPEWYNILLSMIINRSWNSSLNLNVTLLYSFSYFFFKVSSILLETIIILVFISFKISKSSLEA